MKLFLRILIVCTLALAPFPTGLLLIDAPLSPRTTTLNYNRQQAFGASWATAPGSGGACTSRDVALATAWAQPCDVPYQQWDVDPIRDPYTGAAILPADVELDHLFPLAAAWDMGAATWPAEKRLAFANDPLNLVVTSRSANQSKSDKLPGEWMPPAWRSRCPYAQQLSAVASTYGLALSHEDRKVMRGACSGVRGVLSARSL